MSKLLIFFILFIIVCHWSAGMSCRSCGSECVTACGTRRFRTCCFNYLRRKRGSDIIEEKARLPNALDIREDIDSHYAPYIVPEDLDLWWRDISRKARYDINNDD